MASLQKNFLEVKLVAGRNLMAGDSNGFSDPYCKVTVNNQTQKTRVVKKTLNPTWNQVLKFTVNNPTVDKVVIKVLDKDRFGSDELGDLAITLDELEKGAPKQEWYKLTNTPRGEIEVVLTAVNFGAQKKPAAASPAAAKPTALQGQPPAYPQAAASQGQPGRAMQPVQGQPVLQATQPVQGQPVLQQATVSQQMQSMPQAQPMQQPMHQQPMMQQQMQQPMQQPMQTGQTVVQQMQSMQQQPLQQHPMQQQPMQQQPMQQQPMQQQPMQQSMMQQPMPIQQGYAAPAYQASMAYTPPAQPQYVQYAAQGQVYGYQQQQQTMPVQYAVPTTYAPVQYQYAQPGQPMHPQQQPQQPQQPQQATVASGSAANLSQSAFDQGFNITYTEIKFEKKIGAGGFGEVWKGEWAGTEVAIKKILKGDINEADLAEFSKEIMLMSKLRHPNIVQFLGACLHPEFCLLTEFMERGSLFHVLADQSNRITWGMKLDFCKDIAKGMLYLHSRSPPIVHRDIKSLNVLVTKEWKCTIADFGLTRIKDSQSMSTRVGSPAWSAPEVLRGEQYDEKADVFSFGVVMWEIVMCQPPYKGMNPNQLIGQVAFTTPGLRPPIPPACPVPALVHMMVRCWDNNPHVRPSFAMILEELKGVAIPPEIAGAV